MNNDSVFKTYNTSSPVSSNPVDENQWHDESPRIVLRLSNQFLLNQQMNELFKFTPFAVRNTISASLAVAV